MRVLGDQGKAAENVGHGWWRARGDAIWPGLEKPLELV